MPDLKSEMSKVLDEWNKPESTTMTTKPHAAVTNNITQVLFQHVATHPGITRRALIQDMCAMGFGSNSASSMVTQLLTKGNLRQEQGGLFTTQETYKPIRAPKVIMQIPAPIKAKPAPQINSAWDAETLLDNLSIKQARALYDELRKIFGG